MNAVLKKTKILGIAAFLILTIQLSRSEQIITIQGHYVETNYNVFSGKPILVPVGGISLEGAPYVASFVDVGFVATLGKNTWKICATNQAHEWETLVYDGTDTYILMPFKSHVKPDGSFWSPKSEAVSFGAVNAGNHYSQPSASYIRMFFPWIVYGLHPRDVSPDMPVSWDNYALSLRGYGWRWDVTPSADGRFIEAFKVVRDTSLDLSYKDEFLRPTLIYPETIDQFNMVRDTLMWRKMFPNGTLEAVYTVNSWYRTNNLAVPASAEFKKYIYAGPTNTVLKADMVLKLDQISVNEDAIKVPALAESTYVRDFRYRRKNESRIYPFAAYTQSGAWKSGSDPELLAQMNDYLKHGHKYGDYGLSSQLLKLEEKNRLLLTWGLLALVQVAAITIFFLTRTKNKQTKQ
jgi:hypothetical protein